MSEDQFQRQVDFIIEQQARFSAGIAKLEEDRAKHEKETNERFAKLGEVVLALAKHTLGHDERIAANEQQIAALIEATKETDERLNALIAMAERFFSGNGRQG